jgi:DNA-binding transcriptional ArsR family regulator
VDADVAGLAGLIADRARARMLLALVDGRALPASMLAAEAGVASSTASEHLRRLVDGGLVTVEPEGRHRYFRLRDGDVAELLESLSRLAPATQPRSLRESNRLALLRRARTCYDHIAGQLGVSILDNLVERGAIDENVLTSSGRAFLLELGVELPSATPPLRYCVDWTERRHHLSGPVGRALATRLFELGWIERNGVARAVTVRDERARLRGPSLT